MHEDICVCIICNNENEKKIYMSKRKSANKIMKYTHIKTII